ncbi:hypothetical protein LR48_Vigan460s000500 [Vigna angularis]|uniref:Uncharacterized protein n=1 Tax=Phaseolus angularis TaxID=3914 RepID=A0A0L9TC62_PHAAN|nr:hypothetical protein LR48_Vigan460s000500 [Vigna angularis]
MGPEKSKSNNLMVTTRNVSDAMQGGQENHQDPMETIQVLQQQMLEMQKRHGEELTTLRAEHATTRQKLTAQHSILGKLVDLFRLSQEETIPKPCRRKAREQTHILEELVSPIFNMYEKSFDQMNTPRCSSTDDLSHRQQCDMVGELQQHPHTIRSSIRGKPGAEPNNIGFDEPEAGEGGVPTSFYEPM